jgi:hypothetical protein
VVADRGRGPSAGDTSDTRGTSDTNASEPAAETRSLIRKWGYTGHVTVIQRGLSYVEAVREKQEADAFVLAGRGSMFLVRKAGECA